MDGEPAPANAADPTDEEVIEEEGTEEELELTEAEIENVKLKEKITELEKPKTPAAVPITAVNMDQFSEDQWITLETQTGKDRETIKAEYRSHVTNKRQDDIEARQNVRDAIADEIEKNPRLTKLRAGIKEHFDTIPNNQKLTNEAIAKHMQTAIFYAKGKYGFTKTPKALTKKIAQADDDDISYDEDPKNTGAEKGEIEDGEYISKTGEKIRVGGVIDKKEWKKVQSNERSPNDVKIPNNFDEAPSFD